MHPSRLEIDPVVITGLGLVTSVGDDRETVWQAIRDGRSEMRHMSLPGIDEGMVVGAPVTLPGIENQQLKVFRLCEMAAAEAWADAKLDTADLNRDRFGCSICGHMGDTAWVNEQLGLMQEDQQFPWWQQWLPNSACVHLANRYELHGPRTCHLTACASSLVSIITAVRSIQDNRADIALVGGGDAIHPLFAAGFRKMRVLAYHDDPARACRPFDVDRNGFVMGEGASIMVVERLSHALQRGARIYAEIAACQMLAEAHHVTGLDQESEALTRLLRQTMKRARWRPDDVGYINAHGTGTAQNDLVEMRGIRRALGPASQRVAVSSTKSQLGHLVNAAGGAELAITVLAMRDGFAPPTLNLDNPDPECAFDAVPHVGRETQFQNALKISVAFGGHLVAVALKRWNDPETGFKYPDIIRAA